MHWCALTDRPFLQMEVERLAERCHSQFVMVKASNWVTTRRSIFFGVGF